MASSSSATTKFACLLIMMGLALASPSSALTITWDPKLCPASCPITKTVNLLEAITFDVASLVSPVVVYQVDAAGFAACEVSVSSFVNVIASPFICNLLGDLYFIADKANCLAGLKGHVTVAGVL
ncbi:OLC1v1002235C1 [Oldenlandia corymbosa var. corymbosa]|uniref:OLC1v1002235C1 n=1 Tax=Oldenlandia corymbosa var. corymbosa TaxID=529605 RepID=A0AAV1D788_OLDCO|nr:OLC1v1002235C1 [Oldenlandia corymbosa var. corymbosa]